MRRIKGGHLQKIGRLEQGDQRVPGFGIETCRRLVEEEDFRPVHNRGGDGESLALAPGEILHFGVSHLREVEGLDERVDRGVLCALNRTDRAKVLAECRLREERRLLGLDPDLGQQG